LWDEEENTNLLIGEKNLFLPLLWTKNRSIIAEKKFISTIAVFEKIKKK